MSDQYNNFLNSIAGKLDEEELAKVEGLIEALENNRDTMAEVHRMLGQAKENALDIATDEFSQSIDEYNHGANKDAGALIECTQRAEGSVIYDPDFELETVPVNIIAGVHTPAQHVRNENVKQWIEKRLTLALVALRNSDSLYEPTMANLSDDQDHGLPAIETIQMYADHISFLAADISDTAVVILED